MNWLDIAILAAVALTTLQGRFQGLLPSLFPLAGVLAGTFAAGYIYRDLADSLSGIITNDYDARAASFLAVLFGLYLGGQMIAALATPITALLLLGRWARTAGMLASLLTTVLLVNTFLIFQAAYPSLGLRGAVDDSRIADVFIDSLPLMKYLLPAEFDAAAAGF